MHTSSLKALVGLGNPEGRYTANRHNIGFVLVDRIASEAGAAVRSRARHSRFCRLQLWNFESLLVKPQTYMNRSGLAVREMCDRWEIDLASLLIAYDDFALPLGKIRLRPGGSAAGHHGMESIIESLGTDRIPRLRFGIGNPDAGNGADFVLSDFQRGEMPLVEEALERSIGAVRCLWHEGMAQAMSLYNRESSPG